MDKFLSTKLSWFIFTIAIILFATGLYFFVKTGQTNIRPTTSDNQQTTTSAPTIATTTASSPDQDLLRQLNTIYGLDNSYNVLGPTKPKITIVEFGDFTCVHTQASYPIIRALQLKYHDRVSLIWRDRTPTLKSAGLSLAAHCAGEQGQFWPMHDLLFQYQSDELGADETSILALAVKLPLDQNKFKACLDNKTYLNAIKKNMVDSERLNVEGTPAWYVNGLKYPSGELNKADFEEYLLNLLQTADNK